MMVNYNEVMIVYIPCINEQEMQGFNNLFVVFYFIERRDTI